MDVLSLIEQTREKERLKLLKDVTEQELWMVRYLLGDLTEEDASVIEERFFTDDDYFEQLRAVEDALIDDYLQGRLPDHERERVERRLLASNSQRQELAFARSLIAGVLDPKDGNEASQSRPIVATPEPRMADIWERLGLKSLVPILVSAALLAAVVIAIAWIARMQGRINRLDVEQKALLAHRQELTDRIRDLAVNEEGLKQNLKDKQAQLDEVNRRLESIQQPQQGPDSLRPLALALEPVFTTRGSGGEWKQAPDLRGHKMLTLRLRLPEEDNRSPLYSVEVQRADGSSIFKTSVAPLRRYLEIMIPTLELTAGSYRIKAEARRESGGSEVPIDYQFIVTK